MSVRRESLLEIQAENRRNRRAGCGDERRVSVSGRRNQKFISPKAGACLKQCNEAKVAEGGGGE